MGIVTPDESNSWVTPRVDSEEITLVDFLNKMSYTETNKYPFFQKISVKFFQPKNAYYLIT